MGFLSFCCNVKPSESGSGAPQLTTKTEKQGIFGWTPNTCAWNNKDPCKAHSSTAQSNQVDTTMRCFGAGRWHCSAGAVSPDDDGWIEEEVDVPYFHDTKDVYDSKAKDVNLWSWTSRRFENDQLDLPNDEGPRKNSKETMRSATTVASDHSLRLGSKETTASTSSSVSHPLDKEDSIESLDKAQPPTLVLDHHNSLAAKPRRSNQNGRTELGAQKQHAGDQPLKWHQDYQRKQQESQKELEPAAGIGPTLTKRPSAAVEAAGTMAVPKGRTPESEGARSRSRRTPESEERGGMDVVPKVAPTGKSVVSREKKKGWKLPWGSIWRGVSKTRSSKEVPMQASMAVPASRPTRSLGSSAVEYPVVTKTIARPFPKRKPLPEIGLADRKRDERVRKPSPEFRKGAAEDGTQRTAEPSSADHSSDTSSPLQWHHEEMDKENIDQQMLYQLRHRLEVVYAAQQSSDYKKRRTKLMLAVQMGSAALVREVLLMSEAAEINDQDYSGNTALHYSVSKNNTLISDYLIQYGAKRFLKNKYGFRAMAGAENKTGLVVQIPSRPQMHVIQVSESGEERKLIQPHRPTRKGKQPERKGGCH